MGPDTYAAPGRLCWALDQVALRKYYLPAAGPAHTQDVTLIGSPCDGVPQMAGGADPSERLLEPDPWPPWTHLFVYPRSFQLFLPDSLKQNSV